jgi:hypothetical protein
MRKLTILVIASLLASTFAAADASAKAHRRHTAPGPQKTAPAQAPEKSVTRLPVPVDAFRA